MLDGHGRILLIRRRTEPGRGLWSLPGGRCEIGEAPRDACIRETREECGLHVIVDRCAGEVVRPGPHEYARYIITDYVCQSVGGELRAGDDAMEAAWTDKSTFLELPLTVGLLETLNDWGIVAAMEAQSRQFPTR